MTPQMKHHFVRTAEVTSLTISGELTAASVGVLFDDLVKITRSPGTKVVLDLRGLCRMTRAGSRALNLLAVLLREGRGQLAIFGAAPSVIELLRTSALAHLLPHYRDEIAALAALDFRATRNRGDPSGAGLPSNQLLKNQPNGPNLPALRHHQFGSWKRS